MKLKSSASKAIIFAALCGLFFTSCNDKDETTPSDTPNDTTIPIDDNSSFNMKSFITSYDQLFKSDMRWAWQNSHDYEMGNAQYSYQHYKVAGKFGNKVTTTKHKYNSKGVITSSEKYETESKNNKHTYTYEYDLEGYIISLTVKSNNKIQNTFRMEYNERKQITTKTHYNNNNQAVDEVETFEYNEDGTVDKYISNQRTLQYRYENNRMTKCEYQYGSDKTIELYEYDSKDRLIKRSIEGSTWYEDTEYSDDLMTCSEYRENALVQKRQFGEGMRTRNVFSYSYAHGKLEYCIVFVYDNDGNITEKHYFEGDLDNPVLIGYSVIETRDEETNLKTKESVYNASEELLYYAEFTIYEDNITNTSWFLPDGTAINREDITEEWVTIIIKA